ncbi:hypothetical protein AB0N09_21710 [Streptomyces erythrochromogenes]|uniref:hypothetical protein n=1 Tax=Streptomyces erythrochromogenes TaxID=285574 RepID=UPI00341CF064
MELVDLYATTPDPDPSTPHDPVPRLGSASVICLEPGRLIPFRHQALRITDVHRLPVEDWPEAAHEKYRKTISGPARPARNPLDSIAELERTSTPETWAAAPYRITGHLTRVGVEEQAVQLLVSGLRSFDLLPEHHAVCARCGLLAPCPEAGQEAETYMAMQELGRALRLAPGICHGCHKPIGPRERSYTVPGPNLIAPGLGDDTAVFHTRMQQRAWEPSCWEALTDYVRRRAALTPGVLDCTGHAVHHAGLYETSCTNPDCPGTREPWAFLGTHTGLAYTIRHATVEDHSRGGADCPCRTDPNPWQGRKPALPASRPA